MGDFLETLKARAAEAQERANIAKQALDTAQAVYAKAAGEAASWTNALQAELRRAVQQEKIDEATGIPDLSSSIQAPEINKTEIVRDALRGRPTGLTPGDVWRLVRDDIPNRAYVYSVLNRLKARDQVTVRRGKYYIKPKQDSEQEGTVQVPIVQ